VIPIWTLAVAAVAGLAVGVLVGRLLPRPRVSAEPVTPSPSTAPPAQAAAAPAGEAAPPAAEVPAPAAAEPVRAETPRIDMGDVVSELERRYEGRRAEEDADKERRRDRPQPSE
jgi:hypothetical protein